MQGSADPVIHYDGKSIPDGEIYPVKEWLGDWRETNGYAGVQSELKRDIHNGSVQKTDWWCGVGEEKAEDVVVHYYINEFGHGWPSTMAQGDDGQRFGPVGWNGTSDAVEFLAEKRLVGEDKSGEGKEGAKDEL